MLPNIPAAVKGLKIRSFLRFRRAASRKPLTIPTASPKSAVFHPHVRIHSHPIPAARLPGEPPRTTNAVWAGKTAGLTA